MDRPSRSSWLLLALLASPLQASDICTWTGSWDNTPDEATDEVVIESGDLTWDASLPETVASWDQKNTYSNAVTFDTRFPGQGNPQMLTISGDCVISNGTWTHTDNSSTETYRLNVEIGGDLKLAAGVVVHGDQKGYTTGTASGAHGGTNGKGGGPTYGSIQSPINIGVRQSNFDGGGAVRLDVTGATTLDGTISVAGRNSSDHWQGGGAAGSIWLTTGTLTGSGTLRANGGSSGAGAGSGGSGGRVSIILTSGTTFGNVTATAYGGQGNGTSGYGAAGTVYFEKSDDAAGLGELVVDNDGHSPTFYGVTTDLNATDAMTYEFARLALTNAGVLGVGADDTLVITNTTISADPNDDDEGIDISGGTLTVPASFVFSNYFIQVSAAGSSFDPATALTVASNATLLLDAPHTVSGDATFEAGATLTHTDNVSSEDYKVDLTVGGDLVFETGSVANVDFLGFRTATGAPGSGSHGGEDGAGNGTTYGSIHFPTNIGSGSSSGWDGGGAVKLTVAGSTTIDGTVSANGQNSGDCWQLAGSGGSVWLTTATLNGTGIIRAHGAVSGGCHSRGMGGGRIAVTVTNGTGFGSVTMTAYGGDAGTDGAAGTVYLRTKGQSASEGTLLIKNNGMSGSGDTDISASVQDRSVGVVQIFDGGRFEISGGVAFQVSRVWSNANVFTAESGTDVEMVTTNTARFYGDTTFASLTSTNADKRLEFYAGDTIGVTEFATIRGNASTDVRLRTIQDNGSQWFLNLDAAAIGTFINVDVKDSNADPGATAAAIDSTDSLNNSNWVFTVLGLTNTWLGGVSSNWSEGANWSEGRAPIAGDAATVISAGAFDPLLPSAQTLNDLTIQSGAVLGLNGSDLTIDGSADVDGTIAATGSETLTFRGDVDFSGGSFLRATSTVLLDGSGAQSVTSAGAAFYTLIVTNSGRTVTFSDVVTVETLRDESVHMTFSGGITGTHVRVYSEAGAVTLTFGAGTLSQVQDLFLLGDAGKLITLLSSSGGTPWELELLRRPCVRYVAVSDSDAGAGEAVIPYMSTNNGGNTNWLFGGTLLMWDGSASSDFAAAANWTPSAIPGPLTGVIIDGNYVNPPVVSSLQSVRELQIGCDRDSTLKISATLTVLEDMTVYGFGVVTADVPISVSNDCVVLAGGRITHSANGATEVYKLDIAIGGDLELDTGAEVNVDRKGYMRNAGPGKPGSHGGRAGTGGGPTYGSITEPTSLGSGGSVSAGEGGGAIRLTVSGTTRFEGILTSDGGPNGDPNQTPAAGGSIWLTTSGLEGGGTIKANGGAPNRAGGGGRVAVTLTGSDSFGNIDIQAYGADHGTADGAAGTVYLRTQDQALSEGVLIVRNHPGASSTRHTEISSVVTGTSLGEVQIQDNGQFKLNQDQVLQVGRVWSNANVFVAETGSDVKLVASNLFRFYGDTTFASLTCTNADKRLEFNAGDTITIDEFLTLRGNNANKKELRSITDGLQWMLDLDAAAITTLVDLDVMDSDASPGATATAFDSVDSLNNSNWVFTVAGLTNTWLGGTSSNWADSANWDLDRTPSAFDDKIVISNGTHDPHLPSARTLNRLEVLAGAVLELNGYDLTILEDTVVSGTISATGSENLVFMGNVDFSGGGFDRASSTVILSGDGPQSLTSDGIALYTLVVTNFGRTVTFTDALMVEMLLDESVSLVFGGGLTGTHVRVYSTEGTVSNAFGAGTVSQVRDFFVLGGPGREITLESTSGGTPWELELLRRPCVKYVIASDSDASPGQTVYPINSSDGGNNTNWVFDANMLLWDGSDSADFSHADNWTPSAVPDASARCVIDGDYVNAPTISSPLTVQEIQIGCDHASSLKISDTLVVTEDFTVYGYGSVTADVPVTVSNDFVVLSGGKVTHSDNVAAEIYSLDLTIGGDLDIDSGGELNVDFLGYRTSLGAPASGTHGGEAGNGAGETYGSIVAPTNIGSGSSTGWDGGGSVKLDVAGATRIDGSISANGQNGGDHWQMGGAGGSVWITTGTLSGSGTVRANGGISGAGQGTGMGGGRISVHLTGGSSFGSVAMTAYGGNSGNDGGAGTVYRKAGLFEAIIIDNGGNTAGGSTHIPPSLGPFDEDFISTTVTVTNGAMLEIITNVAIEALFVISANESLNLGDAGDLLTLRRMLISGTSYFEGGFYDTNDWNGYAVPPNVSGGGTVFLLSPGGSVLEFR